MLNLKKTTAIITICLIAPLAHAQDERKDIPDVPAPSFSALKKLQEERASFALKTEELNKKQLELELLKVEKQIEELTTVTPVEDPLDNYDPIGAERSSLPTVERITGSGNNLKARLSYKDGGIINVRKGDQLPAGLSVVSINTNSVILRSEMNNMDWLVSYGGYSDPKPQRQQQNAVIAPWGGPGAVFGGAQ